jgi:ABC-type transport system involved in cytochrome bd biosynthesis fused ATPase/permease subunit
MFINGGARSSLLQSERQILAKSGPGVYATIQRLGLRAEELLDGATRRSSSDAAQSNTAESNPPRRRTEAMACIEARGLRKAFGTTIALDGVNLRVEEGRILGLIGSNGAGKTTALNAILGLTPYQGEPNVLGRDPWTERDQLMRDVSFIADVAVLPRWIRVVRVRHNDQKLIASIPRDEVRPARTIKWPNLVLKVLNPVDIDQHHG